MRGRDTRRSRNDPRPVLHRAGGGTRAGTSAGHRDPRPRTAATLLLSALLLALTLTGCDEVLDAAGDPTTTAAPGTDDNQAGVPPAEGNALDVLDTLPVREEDNSPAYRRDKFGESWADVDQNGCDTRNDILHRDLRSITTRRSDDCIVLTGELTDPYTTRIVRFNRERNASAVQIDHVIALADAWRTGALEWTEDERVVFANDPENLLAVDGPTNQSKSDQDAAEWLPPSAGARCPYAARQVGLKARYGLWVERGEADALREVLQACPQQPPLGMAAAG